MEGSGIELDAVVLSVEEKVIRVAVLGVILVVGLALNLMVILYTVCHRKSLKESIDVLLLGSSVVNLMILLSFNPAQLATTFTGKWGFGDVETSRVLCQINGFFTGLCDTINHVLALISVDRFFRLVKPLVHKQYFTPWVSVFMLCTVFVIVVTQSVVNLALGRIEYAKLLSVCVPHRNIGIAVTVSVVMVQVMPFVVIVVTTAWTFCSTHNFIRGDHLRRTDAIGSKEPVARVIEDNLYTKRIKKLFGMFGLLVISQVISVLPFVLIMTLSLTVGETNLPTSYIFISVFCIFSGSICNPIIQSYFRKDLSDFLKGVWKKIRGKASSSVAPSEIPSHSVTSNLGKH